MSTVAILGGGVAGLVAAHELIRRGYEVHVYEKDQELGGMSRTQWHTVAGRLVPGEHGFRVFPSFYNHLDDTLRRTPDTLTPSRCLAERLLPTKVQGMAFKDGVRPVCFSQTQPRSAETIFRSLMAVLTQMKLEPIDMYRFQLKMFQFATASQERRMGVYEKESWWAFVDGNSYAPRFQRYLDSVPRALVAMDAHHSDAMTQSSVLLQHLLDQSTDGSQCDRVLDGPTSVAWIKPWVTHLGALGVHFHLGHEVLALNLDGGGAITGVHMSTGASVFDVVADYYVAALPMRLLRALIPVGAAASDASATGNDALLKILGYPLASAEAWLSGMQFYLQHDVELLRGHLFFPDAEWGLSCVSQAQFWGEGFKSRYGADQFEGVLSVDIANFDTPAEVDLGGGLTDMKTARACTPMQLKNTVWRQMREGMAGMFPEYALINDERLELRAGMLPAGSPDDFYIDQALYLPGVAALATNSTPMLINPPGSYERRPGPVDGYGLHLGGKVCFAGNYMQTFMNLPTMESAAESARHAVNAILWRDGYTADACTLWPLQGSEPRDLDFFKRLDAELYARGAPHFLEILGLEKLLRQMLPSGAASLVPPGCPPCSPFEGLSQFLPLIQGPPPPEERHHRTPRSGRVEPGASLHDPLSDYLAAIRPYYR